MTRLCIFHKYFLLLFFIFLQSSASKNGHRLKRHSTESMALKVMEPTISEECELLGICENAPNYPEEYVSILIKELQKKNETFNVDTVTLSFQPRFLSTNEDKPLCSTFNKGIYPKLAKNINDDWYYILNTKDQKVQKFSSQICSIGTHATNNNSCSSLAYFNRNYEGKCIQKYMLRKMYALHPKTNKVVEDFFQVPNCCTCVARSRIPYKI